MADNVLVANDDQTDYTVATDDDGTAQHQYVKLEYGADGTFTKVATGANALPIQDGGNSITVDGTLAVTQSGTWDEIGINDSGNSITVDDGSGSLTVDNSTLAVVGGGTEATAMRVTVASDSTGVLSVDDNGGNLSIDDGGNSITVDDGSGSLTVDNGGTFATQAAQSGTWTVQPGNTANTTAWKVDGSAVTQPVSIASLPSGAVTNAGTFVVQENGAALTSLQLIDDVVVADDAAFTPATTKVAMAGFTFDDVAPDSVNEGDGGAARMSANRNVYTTLRDAAGNERGANVSAGNALLVDASATTQPVSNSDITASAASLSVIDDWDESDRAKVNIIAGQAGVAGGSGTTSALTQRVVLATDVALPAGTNAIGKLAANSGVDIGDVDVTSVSGTVTTKETRSATGTTSQVADTASSTTILASNANRLGASIQNDSSAVLYIKCGTTASATDYTARLTQYAYFEVPFNFTGRIDGIWATDPGDGAARVTEYT